LWVEDRKRIPARRATILLCVRAAVEQEKLEEPDEPVAPLLRLIAKKLPTELVREVVWFAVGDHAYVGY
jgi:hypothetical protein